MAISVDCDTCGRQMKLPDRAAGKKIACKHCEAVLRVPAGPAAAKAKRPRKRAAAAGAGDDFGFDDDPFGGVDLAKIADTAVRVCARCGREVAEETEDCPYCGADPDTGGPGPATLRKRARGGYAPEQFTGQAVGDATKFLKKNVSLAVRTGTIWTIFGAIAAACWMLRIYCVALPPKMFWTFFGLVGLLVCVGWMWVLQLEVIRQTLQKRTKLKRVNFDMALSASSAIVMLAWAFVMGAPASIALLLPGLSLTVFDNDLGPTLLGAGSLAVAGLAAIAWPGALPHVAMPQSRAAWLPTKQLAILAKTTSPRMYCLVLMLGGVAGVGGAGLGVYLIGGPPAVEFYEAMVENSKLDTAVAKAQAAAQAAANAGQSGGGQALTDAQKRAKEDRRPIDFKQLIVPAAAFAPLMYLAAFAFVFNTRPTALYARLFPKQLDLDSREKEVKYVAKEKPEPGAEDEDKMTWGQAAIASLACPGLGMVFGFIASMLVDSLTTQAGLGVGLMGGAQLVTIIAAFGYQKIAAEENWLFKSSAGYNVAVSMFFMVAILFPSVFGYGIFVGGPGIFTSIVLLVLVFKRWADAQYFFVMSIAATLFSSIGGVMAALGGYVLFAFDDADFEPVAEPPAAVAPAEPAAEG